MSDLDDNHISPIVDNEDVALSKYEDELERMINDNLTNAQDLYTQKLFIAFQNAATNVTKMFRERSNGTNNWNTFHATAESVTMLYKESLDALKDAIQLSILNGEQRKTKEILRWTRRKQRRHIRTNEIYDYLINRPSNDFVHSIETIQPPIVDELQTFRQALATNHNQSEPLENFVRQQVANQLARKRDYHSTDLFSNDFQKSKRARQ